ncbi:outer membrane lipoprotein-sorting protein [Chitinophaga sp. W3I9]|uniref:LolA family protein n=1 Tax=unclassified Chitinophaga TaxID=2619133 RepID=UPI003D1B8802
MMTGTRFYTLLAALLIAGYCTSAQSADELIAKNIVAMGGEAKLKGIKSQYVEGNMEVQGQSVPIKRWVKQDEAMRLEFTVNGTSNVQVVTRNAGWSLMPVMQQTTPQEMNPEMLKLMKTQLDVRGELYDYKNKGKKIELLGKDSVNGSPAYKLKITAADGTSGIAYLDAKTYLLVKATNHMNVQGQDMELVTLLSDYKKTPEGLTYPGVTEQDPGGVKINILKIETNQPVADSLFTKPNP